MSRRRAIPDNHQAGTTYLIHFHEPLKHARHYVGWAKDLDARMAEHASGNGSRLMAAVTAAGIGWHVARTWPGTTTAREKAVKDSGHIPDYCPACGGRGARNHAATAQPNGEPMTTTDERTAAGQGNADATRLIAAAYASGMPLDQIQAHMDDNTARMLCDAQTAAGRAFAAEYGDTARTLLGELRADQPREGQPAAATLPTGTPHPDPAMAAKGWIAHGGIYRQADTARADPVSPSYREAELPDLEAG
jgi:predicted GIY-YIG superfamily endonuclease